MVKIADAKANLSPPSSKAEWVRLDTQGIGNGTPEYPDGDYVGVVTLWQPPSPWEGLSGHAPEILDRSSRGFVDESGQARPWSPSTQAGERWVGNAFLAQEGTEYSEDQIKQILSDWTSRGIIGSAKILDPVTRNKRSGIQVLKRPDPGDFNA